MGGRSLKFELELRGEYPELPDLLTRQRIGVNLEAEGIDRTAWESGGRDRRPRVRVGGEGGRVSVVEEDKRRLGRRERRAVEVEAEAEAMARSRDNAIAGDRKRVYSDEMWICGRRWRLQGF